MKKFLSTILAVVMVLSSMAMVVSAEDTFVYEAGKYYVGQTPYTSLSEAVTAAGEAGTVIVSGEIAFTTRLGITANITLEGVNNARIVAAESFGTPASTTNWKALLNLNGNITVKNITFDGSEYGNDITASTDFVPLRCAEGNITLENVTITGSPRSLMLVGSSSTSATVTANGLYCTADVKTISGADTYADINVVNGKLILNSGNIDGFIGTDYNIYPYYKGELTNNDSENHFSLRYYVSPLNYQTLTSTLKHYVESYQYAETAGYTNIDSYLTALTYSANMSVVDKMVDAAQRAENADYKTGFGELLLAASEEASGTTKQTLIDYAAELGVTQEG